MTTAVTDPPDPATDLIAAAVTAKIAADIGAPRLATRAARRARVLADALTISLSPAMARTSSAAEELVLADVHTTADLCALLRPERDEEDSDR